MQRKNIKNNKGLTLLMLVVTIVVLMILAGISIRALTGDNGAITKSREAKEATEISREKQLLNLSIVSAVKDDEYATLTEESFEKGLTENIGERDKDYTLLADSEKSMFKVTYTESNREYWVDYEGTVYDIQQSNFNIGYFIKGPLYIYPELYNDFDEWQESQLEGKTDEELEKIIEEGLRYWYGVSYIYIPDKYKKDSLISAFIKYKYEIDYNKSITVQEIGPLLGYSSTKEFIKDRKLANPQKYFEEKYGSNEYIVEFNGKIEVVDFSKECAIFYFDKPGEYEAKVIDNEGKESVTKISVKEQDLPFEISQDGVLRISKEYGYYYTQWKPWKTIENVEIPEEYNGIKVKKLAGYLLRETRSLKSVRLPEGLEEILISAFASCRELRELEIPKGVKKIEDFAFRSCYELKKIEIPESVTTMGTGVFIGWNSDQTIKVPFKKGEEPSGWRPGWKDYCDAKIEYAK